MVFPSTSSLKAVFPTIILYITSDYVDLRAEQGLNMLNTKRQLKDQLKRDTIQH